MVISALAACVALSSVLCGREHVSGRVVIQNDRPRARDLCHRERVRRMSVYYNSDLCQPERPPHALRLVDMLVEQHCRTL